MRNYIQPGRTLTLVAPYDVLSGAGLLVGSIFGIANCAATSGTAVETDVVGVFELPKVSAQAWTQGAKLYWDDMAKNVTTNAASGANPLIGAAVAAAANPSATGIVRLNGMFIS